MKKTIQETVRYSFDWDGIRSITEIEEDVAELKKLGATHIEMKAEDCGLIDFYACKKRFETDDEYNERIAIEKQRQDKKKQRDLETYERIKKQYGL